jgi:hypothetical protein
MDSKAKHRGGFYNFWTKEEDALLREHYGKKSSIEIAQFINRTPGAIRKRAKRLQLDGYANSKYCPNGRARPWSDDEIDKLTKFYPYLSDEELTEMFGRSKYSIQWAARNFGVYKSMEFTSRRRSESHLKRMTLSRSDFEVLIRMASYATKDQADQVGYTKEINARLWKAYNKKGIKSNAGVEWHIGPGRKDPRPDPGLEEGR